MNNVIFLGNLVGDVKTNTNEEGKLYAYGKIGVYNGKTRSGEQRESMFFDFVTFGRDAEDLQETGVKGAPLLVMGRLEEDKSTSEDTGKTYYNKRIVCTSAKVCVKVQRENTNYQAQDPFAQ